MRPNIQSVTVATALTRNPGQVRQVGGADSAHAEIDDAYRVVPGKGG
jgi:hypothetical protein